MLKRTYGLARTRYISLEKVANEVNLKAIAYNLTRATNVYSLNASLAVFC
jgi:IS5 family transposase